jgi:hypothetical protein
MGRFGEEGSCVYASTRDLLSKDLLRYLHHRIFTACVHYVTLERFLLASRRNLSISTAVNHSLLETSSNWPLQDRLNYFDYIKQISGIRLTWIFAISLSGRLIKACV